MELETGDNIMCTVDRIVGTIVFVKIDGTNKDPSKLEKLIGAESTQKVIEILKSHKQKEVAIKKEIKLTTTNPKGLTIIKKLLDREDAEIKYISAGRYTIKTVANNLKDADKKQKEIQEEIEKETKKQGIEFQIK